MVQNATPLTNTEPCALSGDSVWRSSGLEVACEELKGNPGRKVHRCWSTGMED